MPVGIPLFPFDGILRRLFGPGLFGPAQSRFCRGGGGGGGQKKKKIVVFSQMAIILVWDIKT